MAEEKNDTLRAARIEMNYLTGDAEVRRMAELREKWEMDYVSGMNYAEKKGREEGIKEGIKKGEKEKQIEIARKLLKKKMDIKEIAEITGLTEKEIENL